MVSSTDGKVAGPYCVGWRFEDSYARLPATLHVVASPAGVREPRVVLLNHRLADELGLDLTAFSPDVIAPLFAGQGLPAGRRTIAQAYAGHQYGHFTVLGDGRAILLGEHRTPDGRLVDIQFKGSGRTRFSRGGDGLAALGPMLREYVISEAMDALGIPTTRSLAVVTTGEPVYRDGVKRGAILTRVAASHLRVGTFEYAAVLQDEATLRALADYAIGRHYPELFEVSDRYLAFFRAVADRQAALIASWQLVGFIHGVMNTDNMAISGETIDYGPCAFMNTYDPKTVFSSIDRGGRYAYGNQPAIARWNLARLAEALLPLIDPDPDKAVALATEVLEAFPDLFERYWLAGMRKKLGLRTERAGDRELAQSLLDWMQKARADFTNTFHELSTEGPPSGDSYRDPDFQVWYARWQERLGQEGSPKPEVVNRIRAVNPAVIPRNHRVEEALAAAEERDDFAPLHDLLAVLASPYEPAGDWAKYKDPPITECGYRTFCGT